jgi:hypothetical protein
MKASVGSALIVALGVAVAAACAGTHSVTAQATETNVTDPSPPGACRAAITRLETALDDALARGRPLATAPESVGAMLHHQPTRDSVAVAQRESIRMIKDTLAAARELRSEGKRSQCISMLKRSHYPLASVDPQNRPEPTYR